MDTRDGGAADRIMVAGDDLGVLVSGFGACPLLTRSPVDSTSTLHSEGPSIRTSPIDRSINETVVVVRPTTDTRAGLESSVLVWTRVPSTSHDAMAGVIPLSEKSVGEMVIGIVHPSGSTRTCTSRRQFAFRAASVEGASITESVAFWHACGSFVWACTHEAGIRNKTNVASAISGCRKTMVGVGSGKWDCCTRPESAPYRRGPGAIR